MSAPAGHEQGRRIGAGLVLIASVLWGTNGTAQALAPEGALPAVIGALRLAVGGALLMAFAAWRGGFRQGGRWPLMITLLAGASIAAYQLCFFAAVVRTGVAVGTVVAIGSSPVLAGMIGYLARHEKPTRTWAIATTLAVIGCGLLLAAGSSIQVDLVGVLLAIGAGGAYACFAVVSKTLLEKHPPEAVMAAAFCVGAVLLLPLLPGADLTWLAQPAGFGVVLHLGVVTLALAYTVFAYGLQRVPVATATTLTLAEPLTASMLGVFFLREHLTAQAVLGIGLIFAGLGLISIRRD